MPRNGSYEYTICMLCYNYTTFYMIGCLNIHDADYFHMLGYLNTQRTDYFHTI